MPNGNKNDPPTLRQLPWLLLRFLPYYLRHFAFQPYRESGWLDNARELILVSGRRHKIAVYDAVLELLLKGYAELADHRIHPQTGRVAVMLTRIGFAFDDEYERRQAMNEPGELMDVLGSPAVDEAVQDWRRFMQEFDAYAGIREFLMKFVTDLYAKYTENAADISRSADADAVLKGAILDSGGLLVALAYVVAKFHDVEPADDLLKQFTSLGVNAKLADDIIDFRADFTGDRPNMLRVLAARDEQELRKAVGSVSSRRPMSARWWRRNCPNTYQLLVNSYREHQKNLSSAWLRYTSSLMWAPALLGHARRADTRGRI
jgi:hypothetical protein